MAKGKIILLIIVVVVAGSALAGFLYWKNAQVSKNVEVLPPPSDTEEYRQGEFEFPLTLPDPPDFTDFR